jgi:hypothetical protein
MIAMIRAIIANKVNNPSTLELEVNEPAAFHFSFAVNDKEIT